MRVAISGLLVLLLFVRAAWAIDDSRWESFEDFAGVGARDGARSFLVWFQPARGCLPEYRVTYRARTDGKTPSPRFRHVRDQGIRLQVDRHMAWPVQPTRTAATRVEMHLLVLEDERAGIDLLQELVSGTTLRFLVAERVAAQFTLHGSAEAVRRAARYCQASIKAPEMHRL